MLWKPARDGKRLERQPSEGGNILDYVLRRGWPLLGPLRAGSDLEIISEGLIEKLVG